MKKIPCPLCDHPAEPMGGNDYGRTARTRCHRCGDLQYTSGVSAHLRRPEFRATHSARIRAAIDAAPADKILSFNVKAGMPQLRLIDR